MNRRTFLQSVSQAVSASVLGGMLPGAAAGFRPARSMAAVDRRARVARHSPVVQAVDPFAALSVGNGRFAFTADVTGLQTFTEAYGEIPLATQAEWGWHSFPNPEGYRLEDREVQVWTWAHPARDLLAVRVEAPAMEAEQLAVRIAFPYGTPIHTGDPADWTQPDRHRTEVLRQEPHGVAWQRVLDDDRYFVRAAWSSEGRLEREEAHAFRLAPPAGTSRFEVAVAFSPDLQEDPLPAVEEVRRTSADHWQRFWSTGGTVDLSESADPRAHELERRIVLSEYLTAIQCAGSMPPQETGLTFNSWHGKFHLEMHWWHAAHFALGSCLRDGLLHGLLSGLG